MEVSSTRLIVGFLYYNFKSFIGGIIFMEILFCQKLSGKIPFNPLQTILLTSFIPLSGQKPPPLPCCSDISRTSGLEKSISTFPPSLIFRLNQYLKKISNNLLSKYIQTKISRDLSGYLS